MGDSRFGSLVRRLCDGEISADAFLFEIDATVTFDAASADVEPGTASVTRLPHRSS